MKKNTFLIAGKHSVEEALKNPLRKVSKVYVTEDAKRLINRSNQPLNLFQKVSTIFKTRRELNNLCGKDDIIHQGILAEVEPLEDINLKDFIIKNPNENLNFIALEEVTDPRNIGSIIRTAASFDFDGIIVKERSYPSKSKLLHKSASGGTEHLNIFKVSNLNTALRLLKSNNFWVSAFDVNAKKNFTSHNWSGKNVLLLTGEPGCGKTSLVCSFVDDCAKNHRDNVIVVSYLVGGGPNSNDEEGMLRAIGEKLIALFHLSLDLDIKYANILHWFSKVVTAAGEKAVAQDKLILIAIDGIDQIDTQTVQHVVSGFCVDKEVAARQAHAWFANTRADASELRNGLALSTTAHNVCAGRELSKTKRCRFAIEKAPCA